MCMKLWMKKKTQWRCCMRNITIIHSVISQAQKYYSWYSRGICTTLCETMYYKERNMTVLDQIFNQISLTLLQFISNRLSNRQLSRNGVLDHHQRWGKGLRWTINEAFWCPEGPYKNHVWGLLQKASAMNTNLQECERKIRKRAGEWAAETKHKPMNISTHTWMC